MPRGRREVARAVVALADFHHLGLTHGDAMVENVLIDLEAGVAHWFDFETLHDSNRSLAVLPPPIPPEGAWLSWTSSRSFAPGARIGARPPACFKASVSAPLGAESQSRVVGIVPAILVFILLPVAYNLLPSRFERSRRPILTSTGGGSLYLLQGSWPFFRLWVYDDGVEVRLIFQRFFVPYAEAEEISLDRAGIVLSKSAPDSHRVRVESHPYRATEKR